jgi:hypothetical protein
MTSTMRFDRWQNTLGQTIATASATGQFYSSGSVVQVQTASSGPAVQVISSTTPVTVSGLSIVFTPKFATSKIIVQAQLATSATYVSSFGVFKDGLATVSTTGQTNSNEPNMQTTHYSSGPTTPDELFSIPMLHSEIAIDTTPRTYDIRATSGWVGTTYALRFNNRGANDMAAFSHMTITEVAQ